MKKQPTIIKTPKVPLTQAEMRIAIARDVIKQIKAQRYRANKGCYISGFEQSTIMNQEKAKNAPPICSVCAIGAAIVSGFKLFNGGTFDANYQAWSDGLKQWFDKDQALLMEAFFEFYYSKTEKLGFTGTELDAFAKKYPDATKRLVAIFQNVIRNKGTFVVPKVKVPKIKKAIELPPVTLTEV